jgi:hypothetical protein
MSRGAGPGPSDAEGTHRLQFCGPIRGIRVIRGRPLFSLPEPSGREGPPRITRMARIGTGHQARQQEFGGRHDPLLGGPVATPRYYERLDWLMQHRVE